MNFVPRLALLMTVLPTVLSGQWKDPGRAYVFDGRNGQIEVGGPYAGAEFHHSRPLCSRISFYYPVANSIDVSTDYWRRDTSMAMALGVQIDDGPRAWIGREGWRHTLAPHTVMFEQAGPLLHGSIEYAFGFREPVMAATMTFRNVSAHAVRLRLYTHLALALRTCQTYAWKDSARTSYDPARRMIAARFDDDDAARAAVFVQNVGEPFTSWTSAAEGLGVAGNGTSLWRERTEALPRTVHDARAGRPVAAFEYLKTIAPGDSLTVIQIIGSCRQEELDALTGRLAAAWRDDLGAYAAYVTAKSDGESHFRTGDPALDASAVWAKGILASNAHYLGGQIVPMPCPAEYNFFFTHDALMTDLAAVNFDLPRVKADLRYIASHARDDVIPHAYYWRDGRFMTEYCTPDNWNHFWFILVAGSYLRHSHDDSTVRSLLPLIDKSLQEVLTQLRPDRLLYAFRPDWWDIGHIEGARAYTTILAIRSLREVLFMNAYLGRELGRLPGYEALADSMQEALAGKLWDDSLEYLVNYNGEKKDTHVYMGSLLAPAFQLLDDVRARKLVATATRELLDPRLGLRIVMPPDFHTKESIAFYKFAGEEAGKPYVYANGGIWPHGNAWYALALRSVGQVDEARDFVKRIMTVDGVVSSPLGQPAMYEYRCADPSTEEYGKVDKPSFLWAGGFYLKTLYALYGVNENVWNISLGGPRPSDAGATRFTLSFGAQAEVNVSGDGGATSLEADGREIASAVLPLDARGSQYFRATLGPREGPSLASVNAIVRSVRSAGDRELTCELTSFRGHRVVAAITAARRIEKATVDGEPVRDISDSGGAGLHRYELRFSGTDAPQSLKVLFSPKP